jgi:hypothetical protein
MEQCKVEAAIRQQMEIAERVLEHLSTSSMDLLERPRNRLATAHTIWSNHKRTCPVCNSSTVSP